jgi:hypothetical protein
LRDNAAALTPTEHPPDRRAHLPVQATRGDLVAGVDAGYSTKFAYLPVLETPNLSLT